ncbi:hypothetical protein ACFE04_002534 [Oxalis oulophora]
MQKFQLLNTIGEKNMKAAKGKFMKKIKSIKSIGYLNQERAFQVINSNGFIDFSSKSSSIEAELGNPSSICRGGDKENDCKDNCFMNVEEIVNDDIDDKENVRPVLKAIEEEEKSMKLESVSHSGQVALAEIDVMCFRRPDMNSGSLFDPRLLAAFEEAVKLHMKLSEVERRMRLEEDNVEMEIEEISRMEEERLDEDNIEICVLERPWKSRRIEENPLLGFEEKCPPGGQGSVIIYTTTLRGIRKTFEDCNSIRFLLDSFRVLYSERDISMHSEYKEELWHVLTDKPLPPRLFINGRYIGGAEEVLTLHEQEKLKVLFEGIPIDNSIGNCEGCAGFRFVICFNCNGSHRLVAEDGLSSKCENCNENGLLKCPYCS